ncbi:MAG: hypothetical protein ACLQUY_24580, partial [Ktedonobacterales bacterium]
MDREVEHVEHVVLEQRLSEKTMSPYEKITSFLLLELGHFSNHALAGLPSLFQDQAASTSALRSSR